MHRNFVDAPSKVGIVLVNWNGWEDTLDCVHSIRASSYVNWRIIICDNGSRDDSIGNLVKHLGLTETDERRRVGNSPEIAVNRVFENVSDNNIVLLDIGINRGFAAGNNAGISYLLESEVQYFWILNNDTVVCPNSLSILVDRMEAATGPRIGMTTVLYHHQPHTVQALGGARFHPWTGLAKHVGAGNEWPQRVRAESVEQGIDYPFGASMMVSREFIQKFGLMSEVYFLYHEEIDWVLRAGNAVRLLYEPNAVVYHKEGQSIGSSSEVAKRSRRSYYHLFRSRMILARRFYKARLPIWLLVSLAQAVRTVVRTGDFGIFRSCIHGLFRGLWARYRWFAGRCFVGADSKAQRRERRTVMLTPNFFVVGVQKAGTTSLHNYLSTHPQICLPHQKETKFFIVDEYYKNGLAFYESKYFADCTKEAIIGEVDPDYVFFPAAMERLDQNFDLSSIKFIVVLRDPVGRAFSHYLMTYRRGLEPLAFFEAIQAEHRRLDGSFHNQMDFSYVARGFYMDQIERLLRYIDRQNLLVLPLEDLRDCPRETLRTVFNFLGVASDFDVTNLKQQYHKATVPRSVALTRALREPSSLKRFCKRLLPLPGVWHRLGARMHELNARDAEKRIQPDDESVRFLSSRYASANARLADFLERDLGHWL